MFTLLDLKVPAAKRDVWISLFQVGPPILFSFFFLVFVLRVEKSNGLGSPAAMHRPAVDLEKRVVLGWLVASGRRRMELAGTIVIFAAHDFGLNEREKGVKR